MSGAGEFGTESLGPEEHARCMKEADLKRWAKRQVTLEDLLAVIHRDGGHHTQSVGIQQSIEDAVRNIHEMRGLMREVMEWHANKNSREYNDCDQTKCLWCELAEKLIGGS